MSPQNSSFSENDPANQPVENNNCLLCRGLLVRKLENLGTARTSATGRYDLMACQSCGLEQVQPRLTGAEILALQEQPHSPTVSSDRYSTFVEKIVSSPLYSLFLALDGDWAGHRLALSGPGPAASARLLDIGCGPGRSARLFRKAGYAVIGLEPSATQAHLARQSGLTVIEQPLETAELEGPFDGILLANVLEHLEDPRDALQRCAELLAPGGWLFLSCPNRLSWQRRLFGRAWINWYAPFHLSHFAPQDIEKLLQESGLFVAARKQVSPSLWSAQSLICLLTGNGNRSARWLRRPLPMALLTFLAASLGWPARALSNLVGSGDCLVYLASKPESDRPKS